MKWWVMIDWADAHTVKQDDEQPGLEWEGPFATFTEMRRAIIESGEVEKANIQNQLSEWRAKRKDEIVFAEPW